MSGGDIVAIVFAVGTIVGICAIVGAVYRCYR